MNIAIAVAVLIIGALFALAGLVAGADPEGRGGSYMLLIPVGVLMLIGAACYLGWTGLRALMGG